MRAALEDAECRARTAEEKLEELQRLMEFDEGNAAQENRDRRIAVNPEVLEAEDALLSFWMIRGGGETGDKAIAPWFQHGNGSGRLQPLDSEQLRAVLHDRLGTDMDQSRCDELLTRLVGAAASTPHVLSEQTLKDWLRNRFPAYQVRHMLQNLDLVSVLVENLIGSAPQPDGLKHFKSLTKVDVRQALRASMNEWVDVIYTKIAAFQTAVAEEPGGAVNLKFAGDLGSSGNNFEGKFGSADAFDDGLDKFIGLPDPKVFDAILNEHRNSSNSTTSFTTSNYGLTCTPKEELEAALNPDPQKTYPGAGDGHGEREIVPLRVFLSAAGCLNSEKWEQEEPRSVLLKIQGICGSLELTEEDKVREALVLLMQALQGFAKTAKEVLLSLRKHQIRGKAVSMGTLFVAVKKVKGWSRGTTELFIERGRELYRVAALRPEEVLAVRMYTGEI